MKTKEEKIELNDLDFKYFLITLDNGKTGVLHNLLSPRTWI